MDSVENHACEVKNAPLFIGYSTIVRLCVKNTSSMRDTKKAGF